MAPIRIINLVADRLKRAARRAGVEISHYRPAGMRRAVLIAQNHVETVIDVGANRGQYGLDLREFGFKGHIISLEPLAGPFIDLENRTAGDPNWAAIRVGASGSSGVAELNVAGNTASSSLLKMAALHEDIAPYTRTVGVETIEIARLDALEAVVQAPAPLMLKLDVQGYELEALRGAQGLLNRIAVLELEISLSELYDGQPLILDVLRFVDALGYELVSLEPGFYEPRTGTVMQYDAAFERKRMLEPDRS